MTSGCQVESPEPVVSGVDAYVAVFFDVIMEPCAVMDPNGVFLRVNDACCRMFGVAAGDLVGTSIVDRIHPGQAQSVADLLAGLASGDPVEGVRIQVVVPDGQWPWLEWSARTVPVDPTPRDSPTESQRVDRDAVLVMSTFHDVTSVRATEEGLRLARDEAEQASRAKSDFVSRMSHELRTPLNAMIGFTQLLQMEELTEHQAEYVAVVRRSGEHLLALVNDVLDVSRLESGGMAMTLEPIPLCERIPQVVEMIRPDALARGIGLRTGDLCDDPVVRADGRRLDQVLLNLLSNAVKYSAPGDEVSVATEVSGGTVSIAVTDTGPGITDEHRARLFTPFDRLGAEYTDIEGTGMGLALSRALCAEMGGALTVSSVPGVGSTFCVELKQADPLG